jgi:hypothetical protein
MFQSYDGSQVVGSFGGDIPSTTGGPSVTVQAQFRGHILLGH